MARMLGATHKDAATTKASCHCGRRQCSDMRAAQRKTQRRVEKARDIRFELRAS